jgi:hypothetical protein
MGIYIQKYTNMKKCILSLIAVTSIVMVACHGKASSEAIERTVTDSTLVDSTAIAVDTAAVKTDSLK